MFKKRVLILFFTIFSIYIYADTESDNKGVNLLNDLYTTSSENIYINGVIEESNGDSTDIILYKKKNRDNYFDLALIVNSDVYKNSSKEDREVYFKNDTNDESSNGFFKSLPIAIFNYGLRNRELTIIESSTYHYKGLTPVKLIAVEKEKIVLLDLSTSELTLVEENGTDILLTKFNSESKKENINMIDSEDSTEVSESDDEVLINSEDEKSVDADVDVNADADAESTEDTDQTEGEIIDNQEDQDITINEPSIVYEDAEYEKVVYQIDTESNIILKKEFYKGKDDRNPAYTVEVNSINYINNNYIATELLINDVALNREYTLKYNPDSIIYDKDRFTGVEKDLDDFYKVK